MTTNPVTVLLVEDEDSLREVVRSILERQGYQVLAVATGPDALTTAAAHPGTIELLLTDVSLPGLAGGAVAEELRRVRPELKVLFMSGLAGDEAPLGGAFISKPFSAQALAASMRELLGAV